MKAPPVGAVLLLVVFFVEIPLYRIPAAEINARSSRMSGLSFGNSTLASILGFSETGYSLPCDATPTGEKYP
jgi:hypothetical protein